MMSGSRQGQGSTAPPGPREFTGYIGNCRSVNVYEKLRKIGEGTYGSVYKARDTDTGEIVALKRVKMEREKEGLPVTTLREIKVLKKLAHPNIVQLKEVVVGQKMDSLFLVFEYCEHDISVLIDSVMKTPFSDSEVKCLMLQLLQATAHMHDQYVIHRDIKLSNLLYTNEGEMRLCDFGLARLYALPISPMTPKVVTLWYRAPELLLGSKVYTKSIDLWSIGCVFAELILNKPVFPGKTELQQLELIFDLLGAPNDRIWPGFSSLPLASKVSLRQGYNLLNHKFSSLSRSGIDLLSGLLTYDPRKRLTAREAIRHPYFQEKPLPKDPMFMPTFPSPSDTFQSSTLGAASSAKRPHGATEGNAGAKRPRP